MKQNLIIYHGSQQLVELPKFGVGKKYNDYGQGFYCTEDIELAKEWACPVKKDGYANKYRADDSYFSFAEDFVNNTISLRDLNLAMQLGTLGEQVVLLSERSFRQIEFIGHEAADYREYYSKRTERDRNARSVYRSTKKNLQQLMDDIFVLDIMREDMKNDDPRLQSVISG